MNIANFAAAFMGLTVFFLIFVYFRIVFHHRLRVRMRLTEIAEEKQQKAEVDPYALPFKERIINPIVKNIETSVMRWTPSSLKGREQELLISAGHPHRLTLQQWMTWRVVFWLFLGIALTLYGLHQEQLIYKFLIAFSGWMLGYMLPIVYLKREKEHRRTEMEKGLPYVLDILTVSVEAGLGFDAALAKVVEKSQGPLTEEFNKTIQEMKMGKGRREALRDLGKRSGSEDLLQFTGAMIQADQLGVRIGNVLRVQSEDMRQKRKQRAEEKAMKAPIKILFPLILFIFPAIFIIILGPAFIQMLNTLFK